MCFSPIFIIILGSFYFKTCNPALLKPFQFQCYTKGICTWPLEYCSSEEYEQRCIPCYPSVCRQDQPPLQCQYNCSLIEQNESESTTENTVVALIVVASLLGVIVLSVGFLIIKNFKLKQKLRNNTMKYEDVKNLLKSAEQERKKENSSQEKDCYGKRKLTTVNPTDTDRAGCYKPTTYKDTVS
ncbi:uncharacterized protein LOC132746470 isoform X2 [Ruditapes philippinarum]|uniref:uncharacterized protein LOC132746470 isoform X2 n=1 Tax=Ruditapes philippinarum TaxID=129788 RepID=UPI00295B298F|nr:uncharacterized protein LOC132746470 isoform X2 [Ruditapes philippinarum]